VAGLLDQAFCDMETEARETLREHAVDRGRQVIQRALDMRYPGQTYTVTISVPGSGDDKVDLAQLAEAFHSRHSELYNYVIRDEIPFVVSVEVTASGRLEEDPMFKSALGKQECPDAPDPAGRRNCYLLSLDDWRDVPVYSRDSLCAGQKLEGPALLDQLDSTTLVEADYVAEADQWGNLIVARRTA
jgi:N-methylhydantoinase A